MFTLMQLYCLLQAKQLVVGNLPDKTLVYSNHVFVSHNETIFFPNGWERANYVQVADASVFIVRYNGSPCLVCC